MPDAPTQTPPKRDVALALLDVSSMFIHLDPRRPGVSVPKSFMRQYQLVLQVGRHMAIPIPDLKIDEAGISCTLQFKQVPFWCRIPWPAVYALVGEDGRGGVWAEDVPPEVELQKKSPPPRAAQGSAEQAAHLQPHVILSNDPGDDIPHVVRDWSRNMVAGLRGGRAPESTLLDTGVHGCPVTFALNRTHGRTCLSARIGVDVGEGEPAGPGTIFRHASWLHLPRVIFRPKATIGRLWDRLGLGRNRGSIEAMLDNRVTIESRERTEQVRSLLADPLVRNSIQGIFENLDFDLVGVRCHGALFVASRFSPSPEHAEVERLWRVGALLNIIARSAGEVGYVSGAL